MSNVPPELKYTESHEWVRDEGHGECVVGLTYRAESLGDLVNFDLPDVGGSLSAGAPCAVAEGTVGLGDVYAPISGEVIAVNSKLTDSPELVNAEPYGEGWLLRVKASDVGELAKLLSADEYRAVIGE